MEREKEIFGKKRKWKEKSEQRKKKEGNIIKRNKKKNIFVIFNL